MTAEMSESSPRERRRLSLWESVQLSWRLLTTPQVEMIPPQKFYTHPREETFISDVNNPTPVSDEEFFHNLQLEVEPSEGSQTVYVSSQSLKNAPEEPGVSLFDLDAFLQYRNTFSDVGGQPIYIAVDMPRSSVELDRVRIPNIYNPEGLIPIPEINVSDERPARMKLESMGFNNIEITTYLPFLHTMFSCGKTLEELRPGTIEKIINELNIQATRTGVDTIDIDKVESFIQKIIKEEKITIYGKTGFSGNINPIVAEYVTTEGQEIYKLSLETIESLAGQSAGIPVEAGLQATALLKPIREASIHVSDEARKQRLGDLLAKDKSAIFIGEVPGIKPGVYDIQL